MNIHAVKLRAKDMLERLGGTIFSFPIEEENPYSQYAVAVFTGSDFNVYPNPMSFEEAAAGVLEILEGYKAIGLDADFERNVRLATYDAQFNSPNVTMQRLKKHNMNGPVLKKGVDVTDHPEHPGEEYLVSGCGVVKFAYITMLEEKNPRSILFMDRFYKLLATKRYGKTAGAIKQEVRRMTKSQAIKWIDRICERHFKGGREIFGIMNSLSQEGTE
nr:hypothetical protein [Paenibacillus xylanexedens]